MPIIVTNDFPPEHGGIQRYMARLARELRTGGSAVTVIAPDVPGSASFDATLDYDMRRYRGKSKFGNFFGMLGRLLGTRDLGRSPIVASLWYPAGLAAVVVPRPLRGKLAVLVHGAEIRPSRGGVRKALMKWVLASADVVIANSEFTRRVLLEAGVSRDVLVVHCGVDPVEIERRPAPAPTVLAVGRLIRRKGFDRLIASLPLVMVTIPNVLCEIVGDGPDRAAFEAAAEAHGMTDRVVFHGSVTDEELVSAYERAWCFALPVRNDDEDVEGFGIVYLEAAMASLPTIGGVRSGAEDAIADGETGYLVDGEDVGAIARAIVTLLRDPEHAAEMGRRGRERALRDFTWAGATERIAATLA